MKSSTFLALPAAVLLAGTTTGFAQTTAAQPATQTVAGTITDAADRSPLPGVTVIIKGTTTGASTDPGGNFRCPSPLAGPRWLSPPSAMCGKRCALPAASCAWR
ncbi:carboxypeptidase-like regulatory domain-containing protein [Hymenobacter qilianensis]|uniref:Carboxypeptidase-like regulatory domain-containing protein n=1 Tax=Hymenobacter qilianensis TaxID=1385715 RepID=A0A7H0GVF7_9BACT|nr:carboxypeptidase-like regulatory domain-containing protein [Hymenobacter qilianensis]QNP52273.1 carboxypeptidase-like regulatory domain-containing protein [Hymenobacter qilianensis]